MVVWLLFLELRLSVFFSGLSFFIFFIASAAKYHSTPVVVCTGLYKLSQKYPLSTNTAEFYLPVNPDSCFNYNQRKKIKIIYYFIFLKLNRIWTMKWKLLIRIMILLHQS